MYRLVLMMLLALFAAAPLLAQDDEPESAEAQQGEASAPEDEITDEEIEALLGLDEDYTEAEDDDFDPTESVRFAQSIPFPTDI
ncbi:MAG: hypothetical protein WBM57_02890 [Woeseiaceae bacterium]